MAIPQFIRKYEVLKELGAGHFGAVYMGVGEVPTRALGPARRRHVAIKKLKDRSNPEAAKLLLQEFALLDQVKHRGIVRVFEYVQEENAVVMELVHGITLRKVMQECERAREQIFTEAVIEIGCEVADALYQAFTTPGDNGEPLRLVHRDLKPENIMLTPQGEVKILDFGLACVDNKDFAREDPNRIRGTPLYMAPEQARGEGVDHRTDLFALGLILYELLMNQPAYRVPTRSADPVAEVFRAIERADLGTCVAELESKMPGMGPVIARCLQARPANRYQNGQELLVDLRRQLYRERGDCLKEFCEFFFGQVFEIEELPSVEAVAADTGRQAGQRLSMEERLRQSMDREKAARAVTPAVAPLLQPQPVGSSRPAPSQGRAIKTFVPNAAPRAATPSHSPPPPAPPSPSFSSPAPSASPMAASAPRPKVIGARTPDETGMVEIVPIHQLGAQQGSEDPSATSFFALPAPKVEARAATPPPRPPQPSPGSAPPMGGMAAPPAFQAAPFASGPASGAPVIAGPIAPEASSTPFQVQAQGMTTAATDSTQRAQSNRVYAIILGVVGLVGIAIVVAVWAAPDKKGEETAPTKQEVVLVTPPTTPPVEVPADPVIPQQPPPRSSSNKGAPKGESQPKATPPPAPSSSPGPLTVTLQDASGISGVEVVCPSNFRQRVSLAGNSATVPNVPVESCTLFFKGAVNAQYGPVRGNQRLSCRLAGSTAVCQ